jgi:hypothetical protein
MVQDTTNLIIPPDTPLGDYHIYLGFYEPTGTFPRLPVTNRQGVRLPNDELPLTLDDDYLLIEVVR